jgi:hypothetical protein
MIPMLFFMPLLALWLAYTFGAKPTLDLGVELPDPFEGERQLDHSKGYLYRGHLLAAQLWARKVAAQFDAKVLTDTDEYLLPKAGADTIVFGRAITLQDIH